MTTVTLWADAAYPPTLAQARGAYATGVRGCGFYLPGEGAGEDPLNQWTPAQVAVLYQAQLRAVPIWVPKPNLPADPVDSANRAFAAARACGCNPKMSGLYTGNHLEQTGQITGPIWIPAPGAEPASVGSQSAIQWGQANEGGWSVDLNVAASDFGWESVIMVDFEYNTIGGQAGINWYKAFQKRIAELADPPPPAPKPGGHMARRALPASALPATTREAMWGPSGRWDVIMDGADGHVYHIWWVPSIGWSGPEDLTQAG